MGTFAGHIDEGVALIILALWWIYNMVKRYFKCLQEGKPYRSHLSYPCVIRGRKVPLEIVVKVLLPVGVFIGECANNKLDFIGDDGAFRKQNSMQHLTIFTMFLVHGITDLIDYLQLTSMKEMKYITIALSFIVWGVGFYYHSEPSTNKPPLELIVHRLLVYIMFVTALACFIEIFKRNSVVIQIIRCYTVLTIGTWFTYISFILFGDFIMDTPNKAWDRHSMANAYFMVTAFFCHLIGNSLVIMMAFYSAESYRKCLRFISSMRGRPDVKYEMAPLIDADDPDFD